MKQLFFLLGFVCLIAMLLPACAPAPEPEPKAAPEPVFDQAAEEAAIKAAMDRMYSAHSNHDAQGVVAEMDESFETWEGDMKGLAAREQYWEEYYKANEDFRTELTDVISVIFVTPEVAIWKARGEASGWTDENGKSMPPSKYLIASVLAKKNGRWLEVASFNRLIEE